MINKFYELNEKTNEKITNEIHYLCMKKISHHVNNNEYENAKMCIDRCERIKNNIIDLYIKHNNICIAFHDNYMIQIFLFNDNYELQNVYKYEF